MTTSRSSRVLRTGLLLALFASVGGIQACDEDEPWGPGELRIASITLGSPTAPAPRIAPAETYQMIVEAFDRDGEPVSLADAVVVWSSSDEAIAVVDRNGLVLGKAEGIATITVTVGDKTASRTILVQYYGASVTVLPATAELDPGETIQLAATVRDADGNVLNHTVTWTSTNPAFATVNATGLVTAVAVGQAGISAQSDDIIGLAQITVQEPVVSLTLDPVTLEISPGGTAQLVATPRDRNGNALNRPVTWTSSNTAVLTVDATGVITAVGLGTATISAEIKGVKAIVDITVQTAVASVTIISPSSGNEPLEIGLTLQLTAEVKDAAGNILDRHVSWSSSDPGLASVDANGLVTGLSRGTVTITATAGTQSGTLSVRIVGESTTAGNNLSVPAIFAEGLGIGGSPVATDNGLRPTLEEGIVVDALPFFYSGNEPDCGVIYYCQGGENVWQAEWLDGSALGLQQAEVAFGDNLTHHAYNTHANIHVEVALGAYTAPQMLGFLMPYSSGTGSTEIQGTDGTTAAMLPYLYTIAPRLIIEKLDDVTRQPILEVFNGAIWETFGGEGEGGFSTEVNLGGRITYGFNLMIQQLTFPSDVHKYGWYRITFRLDDVGQVNGAPVARNVALAQLAVSEDDEAPKFIPQIDPATNTAWVDIEVTSASGGGGGGHH